MTKPQHPAPQVAVHTLSYVVLSASLEFSVSDAFWVNPSGRLFLPLLAAWLGARFGRRGLIPLALAALLIVPQWGLHAGDGLKLTIGAGPLLCAMCAAITLLFSSAPPETAPGRLSGWPIALGTLLAALVSLGVSAEFYESSVLIGWGSAAAMAAGCFLLVLSGRASLGLICLLTVVVHGFGFGLSRLHLDVFYAPGDMGSGSLSVFAALGSGKLTRVALSLAAAVAGHVLRQARLGAPPTGQGALVFAGLAALMVLPDMLFGVTSGLEDRAAASAIAARPPAVIASGQLASASRLIAAGLQFDETVPASGGFDEVTVTAERRLSPADQQTQLFGLVLAALSLAAGLSVGRRILFWWPLCAALLGASGLVLREVVYTAVTENWQGFVWDSYVAADIARDGLGQIVGDTIAAWIFVWIGSYIAATRLSGRGEHPWPGT